MKPQILKDRIANFLQRATEMHKGKFDYSQVEYITAKVKVKIICPNHGEFWIKPDKHLSKNSRGCQECALDSRRKYWGTKPKREPKPPLSKEIILERCINKYGDKFQYSFEKYEGLSKKSLIIICPHHGEFVTSPSSFLAKQTITGCYQCGRNKLKIDITQSYDTTIQQFNEKFNFQYDYPESNREIYKNKKSIIDIICKTHGPFKKKAQKHLAGQGCFQCRVEEMIRENILVGGYSEELFDNKPELKDCPAFLYYLRINNGQFYKIGISRISIENRVKSTKAKAKRYNEIIDINLIYSENATLYECFLKEQKFLNEFDYCRVFKSWSTELFSENVLNII